MHFDMNMIQNEDNDKARKKLEFISCDYKDIASLETIKEGLFDKISSYNIGKKEGLDKGIKEGKVEMIKNMLKKNVDINIISKSTGLTFE